MKVEEIKNWFIWSLLASLGSISVMVFSFLLPAYQEQMDRVSSQEVIDRYESVGNKLYQDGHYAEAEKVFEKAFDFSGNKKLELEIKRLRARVYKVYEQEDWVKTDFEEIEEGDFLFLIETTTNPLEKSDILAAYGIYKSLTGDKKEALSLLQESVAINPKNATSLLNLGNVYDEMGMKDEAEKSYLGSLKYSPESFETNYNLGIFYYEKRDCKKAKSFFIRAKTIKPGFIPSKQFSECQINKGN